MRVALFLFACALAAQSPDPAYEPLAKAYEALGNRHYEAAIAFFRKGLEAAPGRPAIRKDLAYAYLKIGENVLAREQFREAMRSDPADFGVALEYAFLCYETRERATARRHRRTRLRERRRPPAGGHRALAGGHPAGRG
jgi:Tfp pilus assembly protein PilF